MSTSVVTIDWLRPEAPIRTRQSSVAGEIRVCQACGGELPRHQATPYCDGRCTRGRWLLCSEKCLDVAWNAPETETT